MFVASQAAFQGFRLTLVHDRHAADDLVQELACQLWLKFGDYERSRPQFVAWGLGFARLLAFEWRRLQTRLPVPLDESTLQTLPDGVTRTLGSDGLTSWSIRGEIAPPHPGHPQVADTSTGIP